MTKKCYIVSVGSPWMYAGFEWEHHVFLDPNKATEFFGKEIDELTDMVIDNEDMNPEEAEDYRDEIRENMTDDYAYDFNDKWAVKFEQGDFEE